MESFHVLSDLCILAVSCQYIYFARKTSMEKKVKDKIFCYSDASCALHLFKICILEILFNNLLSKITQSHDRHRMEVDFILKPLEQHLCHCSDVFIVSSEKLSALALTFNMHFTDGNFLL